MKPKSSKKKTKTAPVSAEKLVRQTLDALDKVLSTPYDGNVEKAEAARLLWDVLSALRGPDTSHMGSKDATTSVLRRYAFPKTFDRDTRSTVRMSKAVANGDDESLRLNRLDAGIVNRTSSHFYNHAQKAFWALGLKWNEVNK